MADVKLVLEIVRKGSGEITALVKELAGVAPAADKAQAGVGKAQSEFGKLVDKLGPAGFAMAGASAGLAAIGAAAAATANAVVSWTSQLVAASGRISDLTAQSGMASAAFQKLAFSGSLVGVSSEAIATSTAKMQRSIVDGSQAFGQLGLSVDKLRQMKPDEQFLTIAAALNRIGDDAQKTAAHLDIFGKGGASIIPLTKTAAESAAEFERLGLTIREETITAADAAGDRMDVLGKAFEVLKFRMVAAIVENKTLRDGLESLIVTVANLAKWVEDNRSGFEGIVQTLAKGLEEAITKAREFYGLLQSIGPLIRPFIAIGTFGFSEAALTAIRSAKDAWHDMAESAKQVALPSGLTAGTFNVGSALKGPNVSVIPMGQTAPPGTTSYLGAEARKAAEDQIALTTKAVDAWWKANQQIEAALEASTAKFYSEQEQKLDAFKIKANALDEVLTGSAGVFGADGGPKAGLGIQTVTDAEMAAAVAAINKGWEQGEKRTKEAADKMRAAGTTWKVTWMEGLQAMISGFEALGGRVGGILAGITSSILQAGQAMKSLNFTGGITGGKGLTGLLSNVGGIMSIAGAGISILKGIGGLFGIGKSKPPAPPPPTWDEKWTAALKAVDEFGLVGSRVVRDLLGAAGSRKPAAQAYVNEQLGKSASAMPGIGGLDITSEAGAKAQATIFTTTFWALVKEKGLVAGVDALSAPFAALKEKLAAGGFDVDALLGGVGGLFDAVEGPARAALEAADALNQSLQGVANSGYLTRDSVAAYGVAASDAFEQAKLAGVGNEQALQAIAPLLGSIISASDQYGFSIDANTQALIDQAKNAGIAFPVDPIERAAKAMERVAEHLERIYGLSQNVGQSLGSWPTPGNNGVPSYHDPDYSAASGMYIPSLPRTSRPDGASVILAHPGEEVRITPAGRRGGGGVNLGGISIAPGAIVVNGAGDPVAVAAAVSVALKDRVGDLATRAAEAVKPRLQRARL